jgi:hypothetical protein
VFNFLAPPTDNLYKFVAIAGLILGLGSAYIQTQEERHMRAVDLELDEELAELRFRSELLEEQQSTRPAARPEADDSSVAFRLRLVRLRARNNTLGKQLADLAKRNDYYAAGVVAGLVLACSGFGLWYFRIQKYEDAELRERASREVSQQGQSTSTASLPVHAADGPATATPGDAAFPKEP